MTVEEAIKELQEIPNKNAILVMAQTEVYFEYDGLNRVQILAEG